MNWPWLVLALTVGGMGCVLGIVLGRHVHDDQHVRRVGSACIVAAVVAWGVAFLDVVPFASNVVAVAALGARAGLYYSRTRSASRARIA
jgi:hypothetical protein